MADTRRLVLDPAKLEAARRALLGVKAPRVKRAPVAGVPFKRVCEAYGIPAPVAEYRFHGSRRWRLDFAWPEQRVALEVDGGVWTGGRHTRGAGWTADTEKLNTAQAEGWRVLRCTPSTRDTTATLDAIRAALALHDPTA